MVTYSNFQYGGRDVIRRDRFSANYQLNATVDVTVKKWLRKPVTNTVEIAKRQMWWRFTNSGECVPSEIERLADSYEMMNAVKLETFVVG